MNTRKLLENLFVRVIIPCSFWDGCSALVWHLDGFLLRTIMFFLEVTFRDEQIEILLRDN